MEGRLCNRCKEYKCWESFAINSKGLNGRKSICKDCSNSSQRALNKRRLLENPEEVRHKRHLKKLKYVYGLTEDNYNNLLKQQGHSCAICECDYEEYIKYHPTQNYFVVDHDHTSGKVRGLLCPNCDSGLGKLGDTREAVFKALRYLEKHERFN